ncbi:MULTISPECIES: hypothetical protein [Rhodococcus]|uniref:hypothetical protein n=1 Tax=Rhodococcus TaxID=1827 RepID=UPI0011AB36D7|nr:MULTISPECIES: hypothetical protein [Rhodococcus]
MTTSDITPELLRTVGSWLVQQPGSTDMALVEIAEQADRLDSERAAEKRIAELSPIYWDAYRTACSREEGHYPPEWDKVDPWQRATVRAGIRAVLAHLEQKRETDGYCTCHPDERGRTADCGMLAHRKAALLYANTAAAVHPRTWNNLRDVPGDVKVVRDPKGIEWHRTPGGDRALDASTWTPGRESSPFTEVIADA